MTACSISSSRLLEGRPGSLRRIDPHRRQTHFIALLNPVLSIHALAIDAHLALAQQPINPAARHGLEVPHQEIIDPLPRLIRGHGAQRERAFWRMRGAANRWRGCS